MNRVFSGYGILSPTGQFTCVIKDLNTDKISLFKETFSPCDLPQFFVIHDYAPHAVMGL